MRVTSRCASQVSVAVSRTGSIEAVWHGGPGGRWLAICMREGTGLLCGCCDAAIWENENPALFREMAERFGINLGDEPVMIGSRHVESMPA